MSRIFLLLAIVGVIVLVYRLRQIAKSKAPTRSKPIPQKTVRCDYCGIHVPENEAVRLNGRNYCCEEHKTIGGGLS